MELSLWDVEQMEAKKNKKIATIKNVVGRDTKLPRKLAGETDRNIKARRPRGVNTLNGVYKKGE